MSDKLKKVGDWLHGATHDRYGIKLWAVVASVLLGLVGIFGTIGVGAHFAMREECRQVTDAMGVEGRYGFFTGCLVEGDGGWLPLDQVRGTEHFDR